MAKSTQSKEYKSRIRREKRRRFLRVIFELIIVVLLAAVTAFLLFSSVILQESAMSPTLEAGNQVFVNRAAYALTGVRRGDVIAYRSSGTFDSGIHVKRVIGLPGETVQIRDGLILINGKTYMESREFPNITNPGIAENSVRLGSNEYFVLGDNRNNSEDSRFADVGNIRKTNIIGKVWFRIRPYTSAGFVR